MVEVVLRLFIDFFKKNSLILKYRKIFKLKVEINGFFFY